ncbi:hypothetical protein NL676_004676 [Syzygium grande]|nr:hypothetical protein NL676_004676 [Syzygium grande]
MLVNSQAKPERRFNKPSFQNGRWIEKTRPDKITSNFIRAQKSKKATQLNEQMATASLKHRKNLLLLLWLIAGLGLFAASGDEPSIVARR